MIVRIFIAIVLICMSSVAVASSGDVWGETIDTQYQVDSTKSIKELKQNIQDLEAEKEQIHQTFQQFTEEHGKLSSFFRSDLSSEEIAEIEELISLYNIYKERLNKQLLEKAKSFEVTNDEEVKFLQDRLDLFKRLVPYVEPEQLSEYVAYIKSDALFQKGKQEIAVEVERKKEILDTKVEHLKEKIVEHRQVLDEKLRITMVKKIQEKLEQIWKNPRFTELSLDERVMLLQKTLDRIEEKRKILEESAPEPATLNYLKKMELFDLIESELEIFIGAQE